MKTFIRHSISVVFGLYFLIAGTGFNVLNYCCNLCEDEGVEAVIFEIKKIELNDNYQSCCETEMHCESESNDLQYSNPCHLTRYNVDISVISTTLELKKNTYFSTILFANIQSTLFQAKYTKFDSRFQLPPPDEVKLQTGRDILASNAILLI